MSDSSTNPSTDLEARRQAAFERYAKPRPEPPKELGFEDTVVPEPAEPDDVPDVIPAVRKKRPGPRKGTKHRTEAQMEADGIDLDSRRRDYVRRKAQKHGLAALRVFVKLMNESEKDEVRLRAAEHVLEQAWDKVPARKPEESKEKKVMVLDKAPIPKPPSVH